MRRRMIIAAVLLCVTAAGCTIPLGSRTDNLPPPSDDATSLDGRLDRCAALGSEAGADTDCRNAWAEARRRILPLPPAEK